MAAFSLFTNGSVVNGSEINASVASVASRQQIVLPTVDGVIESIRNPDGTRIFFNCPIPSCHFDSIGNALLELVDNPNAVPKTVVFTFCQEPVFFHWFFDFLLSFVENHQGKTLPISGLTVYQQPYFKGDDLMQKVTSMLKKYAVSTLYIDQVGMELSSWIIFAESVCKFSSTTELTLFNMFPQGVNSDMNQFLTAIQDRGITENLVKFDISGPNDTYQFPPETLKNFSDWIQSEYPDLNFVSGLLTPQEYCSRLSDDIPVSCIFGNGKSLSIPYPINLGELEQIPVWLQQMLTGGKAFTKVTSIRLIPDKQVHYNPIQWLTILLQIFGFFSNVESVNLSDWEIGDEGFAMLLPTLQSLGTKERSSVDLSSNNLGLASLERLPALTRTKLFALRLDNNFNDVEKEQVLPRLITMMKHNFFLSVLFGCGNLGKTQDGKYQKGLSPIYDEYNAEMREVTSRRSNISQYAYDENNGWYKLPEKSCVIC